MSDHQFDEDIGAILKDNDKPKAEKISELLKMREDARALQRAETEGGMAGDESKEPSLREIELALQQLGVDPVSSEDTGAATL